jgi:hypothetical protein
MAKQFLDAAITTEKGSISQQDGTALTLTNSVRILYDDTLETGTLITLIDRMKERILELEH